MAASDGCREGSATIVLKPLWLALAKRRVHESVNGASGMTRGLFVDGNSVQAAQKSAKSV
eukprot:6214509-Pleurochrysis_carterae.AAC.11